MAEFAELHGHDAYSLLGVSPDASDEKIQRGYRRLMKSVHPDVNAGDDVTDHAALLNAARTILLTRRAAYDEFRRGPASQPQPAPEPVTATRPEPVRYPVYTPQPTRRSGRSWGPSRAPRSAPPRKPRRRVRWLYVVVAVSVVWLAIIYFQRIADSTSGGGTEPSVAVPAKLAGTWTGTLANPADKTDKSWRVELTLTAGKTSGKVTYLMGEDPCTGSAVPTSMWEQALVITTLFPSERSGCDLGDLYVKQTGSTTATVELHEQDLTLTGQFTKSG